MDPMRSPKTRTPFRRSLLHVSLLEDRTVPTTGLFGASGLVDLAPSGPVELGDPGAGITRATSIKAPGVSAAAIPVELAYVYTSAAGTRLAWHVNLQVPGGQHWYDAAVDAQTGAVVFWADWVD